MGMIEYQEIEFFGGDGIEECFRRLGEYSRVMNCDTFGVFNGKRIFSTDTLDEVYFKLTGKNKEENEKADEKLREDYRRKKEEHKAKIPQLTAEYIEKANGIIREDKMDYWRKCVPVRLRDLYEGMELGATLELAPMLKTGDFEKAEGVLRDQGHSGMSHSLVLSMLAEFVENGEEFARRLGR
jgi:hypothetical protein